MKIRIKANVLQQASVVHGLEFNPQDAYLELELEQDSVRKWLRDKIKLSPGDSFEDMSEDKLKENVENFLSNDPNIKDLYISILDKKEIEDALYENAVSLINLVLAEN
jgi:hypothetical protein